MLNYETEYELRADLFQVLTKYYDMVDSGDLYEAAARLQSVATMLKFRAEKMKAV